MSSASTSYRLPTEGAFPGPSSFPVICLLREIISCFSQSTYPAPYSQTAPHECHFCHITALFESPPCVQVASINSSEGQRHYSTMVCARVPASHQYMWGDAIANGFSSALSLLTSTAFSPEPKRTWLVMHPINWWCSTMVMLGPGFVEIWSQDHGHIRGAFQKGEVKEPCFHSCSLARICLQKTLTVPMRFNTSELFLCAWHSSRYYNH